ncbi:MAG: BON domain-containing protein [Gammaproteobacteria bacterium]|nr:BON domain-containing protein [Gammaproteobacteria bacterium]
MKYQYSGSFLAGAIAMLVMSMPVLASKTDEKIESTVRSSYVFKTYLKSDDIKVESRDGIVTLTGTVIDASHKSLAQETVAGQPDVKRVDNKLTVKGDQPAENSDAWLVAKVKTTLLFHRNVSTLTEVSINNGAVTLRGDAGSQAEKDLTTEYAKDIDGVKSVNNEMTVSGTSVKKDATVGEVVDDASITALVKLTLLSHRSTSALHTKAVTNNGVVTLSGDARNAAEISLATKLVSDVKGVKDVKNHMSIAGVE